MSGGSSHVFHIAVAVVIGFFSALEIAESLREGYEHAVGHAHGILLLSIVRLSRGLAILQTETEEVAEAAEELRGEGEGGGSKRGLLGGWMRSVGGFLVSRNVGIAACVLAIAASLAEVVDDMKPGAHHGGVLLALAEMEYQVCRLADIEGAGKGRLISSLRSRVGPLLFVAAAAVSAMEVYEDTRPGAHHGVAILACAELVENLSRSKVLGKEKEE